MQDEKFLSLDDVLERTALAKSTLYQRIRAGDFPKPVPLGGRAKRWIASEIDQWIADRIANRDTP